MLSLLAYLSPPTTTTTTDHSLVLITIQGGEYGVSVFVLLSKIGTDSPDHNKMGFCCAVAYLARVEQIVCVRACMHHTEKEIDTKNAS